MGLFYSILLHNKLFYFFKSIKSLFSIIKIQYSNHSMIDIKLLREQPEQVKEAISRKKFTVDIDQVIELDAFVVQKLLKRNLRKQHRSGESRNGTISQRVSRIYQKVTAKVALFKD